MKNKSQIATFAAGCFWGVEAAFRRLPGIMNSRVGYTGGELESPTYRQVCSKETGHAEAVELEFDPALVSYQRLLEFFFAIHDPFSLNRQGGDVGPQYRSAIFFHHDDQKIAAKLMMHKIEQNHSLKQKLATELVPAVKFWDAEEYHQLYLDKNPSGYCHIDLSKLPL